MLFAVRSRHEERDTYLLDYADAVPFLFDLLCLLLRLYEAHEHSTFPDRTLLYGSCQVEPLCAYDTNKSD